MKRTVLLDGPYDPLDPLERELRPFDSNQDAWEAGRGLVLELIQLRGLHFQKQTFPHLADKIIKNYGKRIRSSGTWIDLTLLQRTERLTDYDLVLVVAAVAAHFEFIATWKAHDPVILAIGFDPRRLQAMYAAINARQGVGSLVEEKDQALKPTQKLMDFLSIERDPAPWDELRRGIDDLPTAWRES